LMLEKDIDAGSAEADGDTCILGSPIGR
jgi:hypothetical protein